MMIKTYRKTATIKAEQFDGSAEMVDKYDIEVVEGDYAEDYSMPEAGPAPYARYFLTRFDLAKGISVGDWIVTDINGKRWPITDEIFKKTYAELPVIPQYVADYITAMKSDGKDLVEALGRFLEHWRMEDDIDEYIGGNSETFARAWLDGYQVEE